MADDVSMQRYVDAQIQGIHSHIDRQLRVQAQQVADGLATMSATISGFYATRDQIMASLRENLDQRALVAAQAALVNATRIDDLADHVARIFEEKDRATEMAADERERAAMALRVSLERAINEADSHLREHVVLQVHQIRVALDAAELLEKERMTVTGAQIHSLDGQIERRIASVRNELQAAMDAAKEAVTKAEAAAGDKFESHNGLIEQMRQQAVKAEQALAVVVGTLLPRETFDTYKEGVERRLNQGAGANEAVTQTRANDRVENGLRLQHWAIVISATISVISLLVGAALATHGFR